MMRRRSCSALEEQPAATPAMSPLEMPFGAGQEGREALNMAEEPALQSDLQMQAMKSRAAVSALSTEEVSAWKKGAEQAAYWAMRAETASLHVEEVGLRMELGSLTGEASVGTGGATGAGDCVGRVSARLGGAAGFWGVFGGNEEEEDWGVLLLCVVVVVCVRDRALVLVFVCE
jgi:hypothetical protein